MNQRNILNEYKEETQKLCPTLINKVGLTDIY